MPARSAPLVLLALLAALLAALATPATKILLGGIDPLPLAGWLYLGSALGVLPAALGAARRRGGWRVGRKNVRRLAGAALLGGVIGQVALLLALRLASAVSVSLWLTLEAVATLLLGHFFFRDRLGRRGGLGAVGVVLASVLLSAGEGAAGGAAVLLVALACLCWGFDNHLTALIDEVGPEEVTLVKGITAGGLNLGAAALLGEDLLGRPVLGGANPALLGALVGAAAYGWSIALYIRAARELGATRAHLVFATSPFLGAVLSWWVLAVPLGAAHVAAAPLLVLSVACLLSDRHGHAHAHEALEHEHDHRHDDEHHRHAHPGLPPGTRHSHRHRHEPVVHAHPHWPDLHHRHAHGEEPGGPPPGCAPPGNAV